MISSIILLSPLFNRAPSARTARVLTFWCWNNGEIFSTDYEIPTTDISLIKRRKTCCRMSCTWCRFYERGKWNLINHLTDWPGDWCWLGEDSLEYWHPGKTALAQLQSGLSDIYNSASLPPQRGHLASWRDGEMLGNQMCSVLSLDKRMSAKIHELLRLIRSKKDGIYLQHT